MNRALNHSIGIWILALFSLFLVSCREEENDAAIVEFSVGDQSLTEGDTVSVFLKVRGPVPIDDTLTLTILQPAAIVITDPAAEGNRVSIPLQPNQASYRLRIMAVDNSQLSGNQTVVFRLGNPKAALKVGSIKELKLLVWDDESPSAANFATEKATLREGVSEGLVVQVPLSGPLMGEGSGEIRISMSMGGGNWGYGTNYTTVPAAVNNEITLRAGPGDGATSFIVYAVNNEQYDGIQTVQFSIVGGFGSISVGNKTNFSLTLIDDELPTLVTFSSVAYEVSENNSDGISIDMALSQPALYDCQFSVNLMGPGPDAAFYGRDFTTEPKPETGTQHILFQIKKGDDHFSFRLFPIQDPTCSTRSFTIALESGSCGIPVDERNRSIVTLKNNNDIMASWVVNSASVADSERSGIPVKITLSRATTTGEWLNIFIMDKDYLSHYVTDPLFEHPIYGDPGIFGEDVMNWFAIGFPVGSTQAEFRVYPIGINSTDNTYLARFQIQRSGYCISAPPNEFLLTIENK